MKRLLIFKTQYSYKNCNFNKNRFIKQITNIFHFSFLFMEINPQNFLVLRNTEEGTIYNKRFYKGRQTINRSRLKNNISDKK